jgi:hypothetical protein
MLSVPPRLQPRLRQLLDQRHDQLRHESVLLQPVRQPGGL